MTRDRFNILLLCDYRPYDAATVVDHINSFYYYSRHNIFVYSDLVYNSGYLPDDLELERFDCIIVHYSIFLALDSYLSPLARQRLKDFSGLKALFIQDEYRFVDQTIEALDKLGFHLLFTCVPEREIEKVYPSSRLPGLRKVNVLTGYVPELLKTEKQIPLHKRKYDVGYRGRRYPYWHGRLGLEKWKIAKTFLRDARKYNLKCNISYKERTRLYGIKWIKFIKNCRAVLGVESGANVFDFDGRISAASETYVSLFRNDAVTYDEVREKYFSEHDDRVRLEQISSRCFEAITLKTMLILYEGEYSKVLKPWQHYVPLKKDHSNMSEVVAVLRDHKKMATIISQAYAEIACDPKYSFKKFVSMVDQTLTECVNADMLANVDCYDRRSFYKKWKFQYIAYPHGLKKGLISKAVPIVIKYSPSTLKSIFRPLTRIVRRILIKKEKEDE